MISRALNRMARWLETRAQRRKIRAMRFRLTEALLSEHHMEITRGRGTADEKLTNAQIAVKRMVEQYGYRVKLKP